MKTLNTILKVLTALAAVAGAVYVIATYGDEIVAWAKRFVNSLCPCCKDADIIIEDEEDPIPEEPVAEFVQEEEPAQEPAEEAVEEVPIILTNEPVAEETDFAE